MVSTSSANDRRALPAELRSRLGGIADEVIHLSRPMKRRIEHDVVVGLEAGSLEG